MDAITGWLHPSEKLLTPGFDTIAVVSSWSLRSPPSGAPIVLTGPGLPAEMEVCSNSDLSQAIRAVIRSMLVVWEGGRTSNESCGKQQGRQQPGKREDAGMCNIRGVFHGEARLGSDGLPCGHGDWEVPMPPSRARVYFAVFLFSIVSACSHAFCFRLL